MHSMKALAAAGFLDGSLSETASRTGHAGSSTSRSKRSRDEQFGQAFRHERLLESTAPGQAKVHVGVPVPGVFGHPDEPARPRGAPVLAPSGCRYRDATGGPLVVFRVLSGHRLLPIGGFEFRHARLPREVWPVTERSREVLAVFGEQPELLMGDVRVTPAITCEGPATRDRKLAPIQIPRPLPVLGIFRSAFTRPYCPSLCDK